MTPLVTRDGLRMARHADVLHLGQGGARAGLRAPPGAPRRSRTRWPGSAPTGMLRHDDARASSRCLAWAYLLLARGRFWQSGRERRRRRRRATAPPVVAVVPARDEAELVGETVRARCSARTIPGRSASCWWTTAAATAPPRWRSRRPSARAERLDGAAGRAAPAGLGRQGSGRWRRACGTLRPRCRRRATCCSPTPTSRMTPTNLAGAGGAGGGRRARPGPR